MIGQLAIQTIISLCTMMDSRGTARADCYIKTFECVDRELAMADLSADEYRKRNGVAVAPIFDDIGEADSCWRKVNKLKPRPVRDSSGKRINP